jgi:hypothetical protein
MKQKGFWVVLLLAGSLVFLNACQKAAENTNAGAPAASPAETVDTAAIETELMRIENDWPRIIKERDVATVQRIEAEDCVFIYPDGSIGGKTTDVKDIETGALSADSWEVMDLKVNVLNKDAAVVSGRSIIKNGKYKGQDGKTIDISGQYRFIDTYARRNGQWQEVAGSNTPVREPATTASPMASPAAKPSPAMTASPAVKPSPAVAASPKPTVMKVQPAVKPTVERTP